MISIDLSVHELVDYALRSGSIENRSFNIFTMQEGTRLHAIYQNKQGSDYIKEVPLFSTIIYDKYRITLHGRCDGLIKNGDSVTIDEIKTTNDDLNKFHQENEKWHLGQAICYAYLYYLNHEDILDYKIKLTYLSQLNDDFLQKTYNFSAFELEKEIFKYFDVYFEFKNIIEKRIENREKALLNFSFPFSNIRQGQFEFIEEIQNDIREKSVSFIEAPTGIGKTMGAIFGSLIGFKNDLIDKFFYLCPKNSGFENSKKAISIINDGGVPINAVEILAKEKMCPYKLEKNCNPDDCPLACNYYSKVREALKDILSKELIIDKDKIDYYSSKFDLCPFEFSLDISLYVDYIICDYNYVFHPISSLKRFFETPDKQYKIFALVDEAHNLIERVRDMYSASISFDDFKNLKKSFKDIKEKSIKKAISNVNKDFKMFETMEFEKELIIEKIDEDFIKHLSKLNETLKKYEKDHPKFDTKSFRTFSVDLFKFLKIFEMINDGYRMYINKDKSLTFKLFSIDNAHHIKDVLNKLFGATFFSATLSPIQYYQEMILGKTEENYLKLDSPFDDKNFKMLVNSKISTFYKDRNQTVLEIANEIEAYIDAKIGNYMIFVPSFEYLNLLKNYLENDSRFIFQEKNMSAKEKQYFLNYFENFPQETHVGVCVLGGSFSEGIDLVGERLIGVVVVGVGLPQINFENNLIKQFYEEKELNGFELAYVNPGINKILQAIGRVIRSPEDVGTALIIDKRYSYKTYKDIILARYKNGADVKNCDDIFNELSNFYS